MGEVRSIDDIEKVVLVGHFYHSTGSTRPGAESLHFEENRERGRRQRGGKELKLIFFRSPLDNHSELYHKRRPDATLFFIIQKRSQKGHRPTALGPEKGLFFQVSGKRSRTGVLLAVFPEIRVY